MVQFGEKNERISSAWQGVYNIRETHSIQFPLKHLSPRNRRVKAKPGAERTSRNLHSHRKDAKQVLNVKNDTAASRKPASLYKAD